MSPPVVELLYVDDDDDHDNNDDYKDDGHDNNDDLIRTTNMIDMLIIREDPNGLTPPQFGHCAFRGGGSKRLPRWFGALTVFGSIQPCRMVINGPKKRAVIHLPFMHLPLDFWYIYP